MNGRVDNYIQELKVKIQEMVIRGENPEGTIPVRIIELAIKEPVVVDSILFDGYMKGLQKKNLFEMRKSGGFDDEKSEES